MSRTIRVVIGVLAGFAAGGLAVAAAAAAAGGAVEPAAIIEVAGSAEVEVPPDRASFTVTVLTKGSNAAAAASENARIAKVLNEALQAVGLTRDEIARTRVRTSPRWEYDASIFHSKRSAYEAVYTLELRTSELARVGAYVDAALGAGATSVSDVEFGLRDEAPARRRALTEAVENTRRDAEVIAQAAGGSLGSVLRLGSGGSAGSTGRDNGMLEEIIVTAQSRSRSRQAYAAQIEESDVHIKARVVGRWQFIPAAR
jgi:uncharacterized protein YggE